MFLVPIWNFLDLRLEPESTDCGFRNRYRGEDGTVQTGRSTSMAIGLEVR